MAASLALLVLAFGFCALAAAVYFLGTAASRAQASGSAPEPAQQVEDVGRTATRATRTGAGRMRRRARAAAAGPSTEVHTEDRDSSEEESEGEEAGDGYYAAKGSKKGAKKQEKEAKRQAEQAARDLKREKEDRYAEARRKKDEAREEDERRKQEAAEAERTAEEAAAEDEFKKWKDMISTEGEGTVEQDTQEESQGLLAEFVDYIKEKKMVVLEDLAADFNLRTQDVINRIHALESIGRITGVMDDRGKFIYISTEEMQALADYIKRVGRVSISHLASKSNELIDLNPKLAVESRCQDEVQGQTLTLEATETQAQPVF